MKVTPFQSECIGVLAYVYGGRATAAQVAHAVAARRRLDGDLSARGSRLRFGVSSALRALLHNGVNEFGNPKDESEHIVRLAPVDRWDAATWCLTETTFAWVRENLNPRR